jgi:hypothetical protein
MLEFLSTTALSTPCFNIIWAMIQTGKFVSRNPNKDHPTKIHLKVQEYLNEIYNGHFMGADLSPIANDWERIEQAITMNVPRDHKITIGMDEYFWNPRTNKSQFLIYLNLKPFLVPEVKDQDTAFLKKRELSLDMCRCGSLLCPKYEQCMRSRTSKGNTYSYAAFFFTKDGCSNFIGE